MNEPPNYRMSARERLHLLAPNRGGQGDIPLVEVRHAFQGLQDNNYGNSLFVEPGQSQLLLRAHGDDDMPHMIAISASHQLAQPLPTPAQVAALGFDVAPYLVLKFGAGGANMEYEIDLLSGIIFNVSATSFDLEVHNPIGFNSGFAEGASNAQPVGLGWKIFAQASMGLGGAGRANINPARRTVVVGDIDPLGGAVFPIPAGAVSVNLSAKTQALLGALDVTQQTYPGANFDLGTTSSPNFDNAVGAVQILPGARSMLVTNTSNATQAQGVRAIFTLAF
jgi:hypothetical protein